MAQVAAIQQRQAAARAGTLTSQGQQELKELKHDLASAEGAVICQKPSAALQPMYFAVSCSIVAYLLAQLDHKSRGSAVVLGFAGWARVPTSQGLQEAKQLIL